MLANFLHRFRALISRRRFAGTDPLGNRYFEELDVHPGRSRRTVIHAGLSDSHDVAAMQPRVYNGDVLPGWVSARLIGLTTAQWRAWLAHTRHDAPSFEVHHF